MTPVAGKKEFGEKCRLKHYSEDTQLTRLQRENWKGEKKAGIEPDALFEGLSLDEC